MKQNPVKTLIVILIVLLCLRFLWKFLLLVVLIIAGLIGYMIYRMRKNAIPQEKPHAHVEDRGDVIDVEVVEEKEHVQR